MQPQTYGVEELVTTHESKAVKKERADNNARLIRGLKITSRKGLTFKATEGSLKGADGNGGIVLPFPSALTSTRMKEGKDE